MDWSASQQNVDTDLLMTNLMGSVVKSPKVYKCPADRYKSPANPGDRVRSLAMNGALAGPGGGSGPTVIGKNPDNRTYYGSGGLGTGAPVRKMTELSKPSNVWAATDEQADSINDFLFMVNPGAPAGSEKWRDLPASYHAGSGSFSFTDGHSEIHKWKDGRTAFPVSYQTYPNSASSPWGSINLGISVDYEWLNDRMPYNP